MPRRNAAKSMLGVNHAADVYVGDGISFPTAQHTQFGMCVNRHGLDDRERRGPYCLVAALNLAIGSASTGPRSLTSTPCGYRTMLRQPSGNQDGAAAEAARFTAWRSSPKPTDVVSPSSVFNVTECWLRAGHPARLRQHVENPLIEVQRVHRGLVGVGQPREHMHLAVPPGNTGEPPPSPSPPGRAGTAPRMLDGCELGDGLLEVGRGPGADDRCAAA